MPASTGGDGEASGGPLPEGTKKKRRRRRRRRGRSAAEAQPVQLSGEPATPHSLDMGNPQSVEPGESVPTEPPAFTETGTDPQAPRKKRRRRRRRKSGDENPVQPAALTTSGYEAGSPTDTTDAQLTAEDPGIAPVIDGSAIDVAGAPRKKRRRRRRRGGRSGLSPENSPAPQADFSESAETGI